MKGYDMIQQKVYVQQDWTDDALLADGFLSYRPFKSVTMVRKLPAGEAPKTMKAGRDIVTAEAGYWIAYVAGEMVKSTLDDYKPRPIEPDIFAETYHAWDEPNWKPTLSEIRLKQLGCTPYYKIASIWAKQLTTDTWIKGIESDEPSLSIKGAWLCIGMEGEPWSITDAWFQAHYQLPGRSGPKQD
jgi:hypothetical protein